MQVEQTEPIGGKTKARGLLGISRYEILRAGSRNLEILQD